MDTTLAPWDERRFADALRASPLTTTALALELRRHGYIYEAESVRNWTKRGSTGPKHPAIVALLENLVGLRDEEVS